MNAEAEGGLIGWAVGLMESLGEVGAGLAIALETVFPPLPSEAILLLAGFAANRGEIDLVPAVLCTTAGSMLGALLTYWVGGRLGRHRMVALVARLPLVKAADVERAEAWFAKHSNKAVFFGRMMPVFRALISVPAGVERMPLGRFVVYSTLGTLVWNTAFIVAGYLVGENWAVVEEYSGVLSLAVLALCLLAVARFVATRLSRARREGGGSRDAA